MKFDAWSKTAQARSLRYQRVVYIVCPATSKKMGVEDGCYYKIGISKYDVYSRFRAYMTYWPSNVLIHAIAVVKQPHTSDIQVVRQVEAAV